jgi:hypothetical protein
MNDPIMFINRLRETKLLPPLSYTIRELLIAQGEIEPLNGQGIDLNLINGEMMGIPLPRVTEQLGYIKTTKETIESLYKEANGKMGDGNTISLTALAKEMDKLITFFNNRLTAEPGSEAEAIQEPGTGGEARANAPTVPGLRSDPAPVVGAASIAQYKPQTRADALALL